MPRPRSPQSDHDFLAREIAALTQGQSRSWAHIGYLLDRIDQTDYWRNEAKSFTEWLKGHAESLGLKESTLWRYLTAGRYYIKLREALTGRGVSCPPLGELPDKVSPENLELLSKLARVAPDNALQRLAEQVLSGGITRAELRTVWQAYRPARGGRTARGLGVPPPRINLRNREQFESLTEAMVLTSLASGDPSWSGIRNPDLYELFMHISPESDGATPRRYIFDAVAVIRDRKSDPLQIHGIEIAGGFHVNWSGKLEGMAPYFNFLWIAVPEQAERIEKLTVPDFVGILRVMSGHVVVERPPRQSDLLGGRVLEMTKGLLLKSLKR